MKTLILIGAGGFFGSVARYLTSKYIQDHLALSFPIGTLVVNIVGCFTLGVIYGFMERGEIFSQDVRIFLTIGFCGGFTTFSTFAYENVSLLRDGNFIQSALYIALSVFAGIIALYLGNIITKII
ncbi:MAG: fluoride efflux transporter CrcB [Bacteroidales bacterium]